MRHCDLPRTLSPCLCCISFHLHMNACVKLGVQRTARPSAPPLPLPLLHNHKHYTQRGCANGIEVSMIRAGSMQMQTWQCTKAAMSRGFLVAACPPAWKVGQRLRRAHKWGRRGHRRHHAVQLSRPAACRLVISALAMRLSVSVVCSSGRLVTGEVGGWPAACWRAIQAAGQMRGREPRCVGVDRAGQATAEIDN